MNRIYQMVKKKRISSVIFTNYLETHQIDIQTIKEYKNTWGESILTYAIKYGNNIEFFDFLYENGFILTGNYYNMTAIDICVAYNKNNASQKLSILDWLYNKNIQFNPFYLLVYPRLIITWIREKQWIVDVNFKNENGNTALHEVCKLFHHTHPNTIYNNLNNNSYDAFYVLLEMGWDPNIKNNFNNTCIDYCIKNSLINNFNILYYFHYELTKGQIEELIECDIYLKLIKHTIWILINYKMLNIDYTKSELEHKLFGKIIDIQLNITEYCSNYDLILKDINNKTFFDNCYNLQMFNIDENMFY